MSVLEQLLFAILGVTLLTASLLLSDPYLGVAASLQRDSVHTLQSCPSR
jgi:hypothetical protein